MNDYDIFFKSQKKKYYSEDVIKMDIIECINQMKYYLEDKNFNLANMKYEKLGRLIKELEDFKGISK